MAVAELEQYVLLDVSTGIQIWLPRALASEILITSDPVRLEIGAYATVMQKFPDHSSLWNYSR